MNAEASRLRVLSLQAQMAGLSGEFCSPDKAEIPRRFSRRLSEVRASVLDGMRSILLVTSLAALVGCHGISHYQHNIAKVEGYFKACMNASPSPESDVEFETKIEGCRNAAYAADPERLVNS